MTFRLLRAFHSLVRKPAPPFTAKAVVEGGTFQTIKSADLMGKYWVLCFYPLDFTFVCPTEIIAFNDRLDDFHRIGCEVLAASVDSEYAHLAWTKQPREAGGLGPATRIPLLSDLSRSISRDWGVLVEEAGMALRGLFVIDKRGIVRHATINDLGIGRSVEETLRIVRAIQFNDEHGEVCPAGWKPGDASIKPTPKDSLKFFTKK